jgi:hypothetical protein
MNFFYLLFLLVTLGPGVYSGSNRNKYQKEKKKCFWGAEKALFLK